MVLWWATESKANNQRSFSADHKNKTPQSHKHPSLMGDYNFPEKCLTKPGEVIWYKPRKTD